MPSFPFRRHRAARSRTSRSASASTAASTRTTTTTTTAVSSPTAASERHTTAEAGAPRYPEAIPCFNYYDIYPEDAGPTGHLVVDSPESLCVWKLVAKPVTEEEATKKGGCIQYVGGRHAAAPVYFAFSSDADEVYGRASYMQSELPGSPSTNGCVVKQFPQLKHVDVHGSSSSLPSVGLKAARTMAG